MFEKLLLVCEADAKGRGFDTDYPQAQNWRDVLDACETIEAKTLIAEGYTGEAIKLGLHQRRVDHIQHWKNNET